MNFQPKSSLSNTLTAKSHPTVHPGLAGQILTMLLCLLAGSSVLAQVPDNFSYQGYLTDSNGQPVDQPVTVELALYAVSSGGSALWSETQSITPVEGVFTATLGQDVLNLFPANLFDTPLYLGITVDSDTEMLPRTELTTAPFSHKARDAETVDGFSASQLDQSSDITQLQTDLAAAEQDLLAVESTLPTLQTRVSQSCAAGSSIRQILSTGTVACEIDDAGPWLINGTTAYLSGIPRVGIGTTAAAAALQIDAPVDTDPFRARVQSSTKLRVHTNGSVSVGTSSSGPENGLYVFGEAGFGTHSPSAHLTVADPLWQTSIDNNDTGGDDWFVGSSAIGWAIGGGKYVISPTDSSSNAALVIDANKDVGIGVTDPLSRLHIGGGTDVSPTGGAYLTMGNITGANVAIDSNEIMARSNGAVATLSLNAEGGEVRINSAGSRDDDALEVRGVVYFDNGGNSGMRMTETNSSPTNAVLEPTLYEEGLIGQSARPFWRVYSREFYAENPLQYKTYSDRSLKQNIVSIPNALGTVLALNGVSYKLSKHPMDSKNRTLSDEEKFDRENQLGFIAQDLEKVLPQLVSEDEFSGLKTVGYMGLIPILVEAIKAQQRQIDTQGEQIELLLEQLR